MSRGLVTTSRFSPGNMSGEALQRLFVGRADLMKDVLKRLHASATSGQKHHLLLVGPRGIGKTHFVALAYHRLKTDVEQAQALERLRIAYLNEEEWGIASYLDFLVRVLQALAAEHGEVQLTQGIERIYEKFKRSPEAAHELAETTLKEFIQGRTLLLICENLEDLFAGLGEEGQQRWRSFIQESGFWAILATTPSLFSDVQSQESAFHNFFTIRPLKNLDLEMAMELLRERALLEGKTRLADFLQTPIGRARVRAIHHLAGGNHRVYVILSDFLDEESLEGLVKPFLRMADDLTPYYQDRMRQLSPQQRKVVELLCQHPQPVSVKNIAARCLMAHQVASKHLSDLSARRFVVKSDKVGREVYYELAEPLMRICLDIKDRRTEHFRLFADFLRHWFTGRELKQKLEWMEQLQSTERTVDRLHVEVALREYNKERREPFLESLTEEVGALIGSEDYVSALVGIDRLLEEKSTAAWCVTKSGLLMAVGRTTEALKFTEMAKGVHVDNGAMQIEHAINLALVGQAEAAIRAFETVDVIDDNLLTTVACSRFYLALGDLEKADDFVTKGLTTYPQSLSLTTLKARMAHHRGRLPEAEEGYRAYLNKFPGSKDVLELLATVLCEQGKIDEGVKCFEAVSVERMGDRGFGGYWGALMSMSRFREAREIANRRKMSSPGELHAGLLEVIATVGAVGFGAALELLGVFFDDALKSGRLDVWKRAPGLILLAEHETRGAVAMSRQVAQLRTLLEKHHQQHLLGEALTELLTRWLPQGALASEEWRAAVPILEGALADMPECRIPLRMLSVAVRYKQSGDASVLLELALEERTLLLEGLGESTSGGEKA